MSALETDGRGHLFKDVDNIRITYVPAKDRKGAKNWAGSDVLRIQAYKGPDDRSLHMGAELPVAGPHAFVSLISTLCVVYDEGRSHSR